MDSSGFVQDQVADSCDHNTKSSESRKGITFLDHLNNYNLLKQALLHWLKEQNAPVTWI